jgi:very-short-patch-repair endonuclease
LATDSENGILRCVGKTPRIPSEFRLRPFSLDEARDAGLTRHSLRRQTWKRIGARLYRWTDLPEDLLLTLSAWRSVLPPETVFAGASAAWLHGLDIEPADPVEVVVPPSCAVRTRVGLIVRHARIPTAEVVSVRGFRATDLPLALARLCLQRPAVEALVAIDMAIYRGLIDQTVLAQYAEESKLRAGVQRMKSIAKLAAPAESPMETRLRWLLIQAGLPGPQVQAELSDASARLLGRVDLYYAEARLAVEYDGGYHRERMVEDNRRQNLLISSGYRVLRFTAADIHNRADVVIAQVRAALYKPR